VCTAYGVNEVTRIRYIGLSSGRRRFFRILYGMATSIVAEHVLSESDLERGRKGGAQRILYLSNAMHLGNE